MSNLTREFIKFNFSGMLYNFSSLIDSYGMIPNGNRIYFGKRSQPPLFISMVDAFYEVNTITYLSKYRGLLFYI